MHASPSVRGECGIHLLQECTINVWETSRTFRLQQGVPHIGAKVGQRFGTPRRPILQSRFMRLRSVPLPAGQGRSWVQRTSSRATSWLWDLRGTAPTSEPDTDGKTSPRHTRNRYGDSSASRPLKGELGAHRGGTSRGVEQFRIETTGREPAFALVRLRGKPLPGRVE